MRSRRPTQSLRRLGRVALLTAFLLGANISCTTLADRLHGSWQMTGKLDRKGKHRPRSPRKPTIRISFDKQNKTFVITQKRRRRKPTSISGHWTLDDKSRLLTITVGTRVKKPVTLNLRFEGEKKLVLRNARRKETRIFVRRTDR